MELDLIGIKTPEACKPTTTEETEIQLGVEEAVMTVLWCSGASVLYLARKDRKQVVGGEKKRKRGQSGRETDNTGDT